MVKVYSWSNINSFHQAEIGEGCYYAYYLQYIKREKGIGNFFSELGSIVHDMLNKIHNEEIFEWDIENELIKRINNMEYEAPFPAKKSYIDPIIQFFEDGIDVQFKDYVILSTEDKASIDLNGVKFFIKPDLMAEHEVKRLVVGDYKISKPYVGETLQHNIQQLYIYSEYMNQLYDMYPDYLVYWYLREPFSFREYFFEFNKKDLERTKYFILSTIEKIEKQTEWKPKCEEVDGSKWFFACQLCPFRNNCEYRYVFANKNAYEF